MAEVTEVQWNHPVEAGMVLALVKDWRNQAGIAEDASKADNLNPVKRAELTSKSWTLGYCADMAEGLLEDAALESSGEQALVRDSAGFELMVMADCLQILASLPYPTRYRVLTWLKGRIQQEETVANVAEFERRQAAEQAAPESTL
jgi:hypothetical protein